MARKRPKNRRRVVRYPKAARSAALRITPQPHPTAQTDEELDVSAVPSQDAAHDETADHNEWMPPVDRESATRQQRTVVSADSIAAANLSSSDDLESYVQSIESAAARERALQRDGGIVAAKTGPVPVDRRTGSQSRRATGRHLQSKKKPAKRWYRRRKTWFIIGATIPALLILIISLYLLNILRLSYSAYQDIHEDPVTERTRYRVNAQGTAEPVPSEQAPALEANLDDEEPINIVLMGVDFQAEDDENPPRSDTTIVLHINPKTKEVAMMSIPRDVLVTIPGFGNDKMNAAYPLGEANEDEIPGGGPTLVAQTIEANFNIPIHFYATIDFEGFVDMVNTVDGVIVDAQAQISDNLYPTEDLRLTRAYFPTGLQKLDGQQALRYVRTRHGDSDIARGTRQQQVLMSLRERAITFDLITRAPELINNLGDTLRTDMDLGQMLSLANLGRSIDSEAIVKIDLWGSGALTEHYPDFEGDPYYMIADWPMIHELQAEVFGISPPGESGSADAEFSPDYDVPVIVENATNYTLLAGHSAQMLFDAGFTAVWPSDADQLEGDSKIYDYTDNLDTARYIARTLGLPETAIIKSSGGEGVIITLGDDVPVQLIPPQPEEQ